MRKFRVQSSLFIVILVAIFLPTVYAAESTTSAEEKSAIETLKQTFDKEVASIAAKLAEEISKKLTNKAYVGVVKTQSESSITLAAKTGPKIVSINEDTEFESNLKSRQKFSALNVEEEDYIAALGDVDETGVLLARKIVLLSPTQTGAKTSLWGQIVSVSEKLATLKDRNGKNVAVSVPASSSIELNDFVILTGNFNKNEIFEIDFSYVIPQGRVIKPRGKIIAPTQLSATPSASPSSR